MLHPSLDSRFQRESGKGGRGVISELLLGFRHSSRVSPRSPSRMHGGHLRGNRARVNASLGCTVPSLRPIPVHSYEWVA